MTTNSEPCALCHVAPTVWMVMQAGAPFGAGWLDESQAKAQGRASALGDGVSILRYVPADETERLLRRVVALWEYVSGRSGEREDARVFQRELDAADGQLVEDVRAWLVARS